MFEVNPQLAAAAVCREYVVQIVEKSRRFGLYN